MGSVTEYMSRWFREGTAESRRNKEEPKPTFLYLRD